MVDFDRLLEIVTKAYNTGINKINYMDDSLPHIHEDTYKECISWIWYYLPKDQDIASYCNISTSEVYEAIIQEVYNIYEQKSLNQ